MGNANVNIIKYLNKIDPYNLGTAFEVAFDLAPHMDSSTAYSVPENELFDLIEDLYERYPGIPHHILGRMIVRHFNLE